MTTMNRRFLPLLFSLMLLSTGSGHSQSIVDFPAAGLVLGQGNFTTGSSASPPTASSLGEMSAVIVDPASGKVFVADTDNNRVLRYPDKDALANGAAAEYVFGQADFSAALSPSPPTASSLNSPTGLALEVNGNLWVSDTDNHRVLMYASAVTRVDASPAAVKVFGQPDFVSNSTPGTPSVSSMNAPMGLHLDTDSVLWVADFGNNRVLQFVSAELLADGAPAFHQGLLGQPDFLTSAPGSNATSFSGPTALSMDEFGTLWVADRGNNRVSGFPLAKDAPPGTAATRVLGQSDFASVAPGLSASRLDSPSGIFIDGTSLWVLDQSNNRALRFPGIETIANGAAATTVVGQPDFTTNETAVNARRFASPFIGIFVDTSGSLWISDIHNNRILRFDTGPGNRPTLKVRGKTRLLTSRGSVLLRGTASADVAIERIIVQNRTLTFTARGKEKWKSRVRLLDGRNVLRVTAVDDIGAKSRPVRVVVTKG
jgi:sugar lactone lactonase YvrE